MHNPQDNLDTAAVDDPFAMLINPQAVLQAIEQSGRLGALASRVCRPLDKPLIPKRDSAASKLLGGKSRLAASDSTNSTFSRPAAAARSRP